MIKFSCKSAVSRGEKEKKRKKSDCTFRKEIFFCLQAPRDASHGAIIVYCTLFLSVVKLIRVGAIFRWNQKRDPSVRRCELEVNLVEVSQKGQWRITSQCSFNEMFTLPVKDPRNLATFRAIFALFTMLHTYMTHIHAQSHAYTYTYTILFVTIVVPRYSSSYSCFVNILCKYCSTFLWRAGRVKTLIIL